MIKCAYQTPREICYAVNDCVGNLNLTPRPWIFQEPNTCHWWLVPSAEWPAYKHGKLYFGWANDERTGFLVGFHVEKGLGTSVKAVYPKAKGLFMEGDWHWNRFLLSLDDGSFADRVAALRDLESPVIVRISGFYVQNPTDYDPYSSLRKPDVFTFEWNRESGQFSLRNRELHIHAIERLNITAIDELVRELKRLNQNPWLWVDIHVGIEFHRNQVSAPANEPEWNASEMWRRFLQHFRGVLLSNGT